MRNNPIGLAEPSNKRDGYAVGSKEGSMYRSTGNLNVSSGTVGSRAASESRDIPKGSWKERRASTSDLKGSGIRTGGNLVEPSAKPCMPFGSGGGGAVLKRRQVNKSSQQKTTRSSSTSRTTSSTMQQVSTALEQIQVIPHLEDEVTPGPGAGEPGAGDGGPAEGKKQGAVASQVPRPLKEHRKIPLYLLSHSVNSF